MPASPDAVLAMATSEVLIPQFVTLMPHLTGQAALGGFVAKLPFRSAIWMDKAAVRQCAAVKQGVVGSAVLR